MDYHLLKQAVEHIKEQWPEANPQYGAILGSGWNGAISSFKIKNKISYENIPGMEKPGVKGHAGQLIWAECCGLEALLFQGRRHYYEGIGWTPIALPIFVCQQMNVSTVVLTNAAGGLADGLRPGSFMLIEDHINWMGHNPLMGPHDPVWGPRFPDQTQVYDSNLKKLTNQAATIIGEKLHHGIYLATSGPMYETPAEIRTFLTMGADAVGMSTVPEAILAHAAGIRVLGISCIANKAAGLGGGNLSHEEVLEITQRAVPRMQKLFLQLWHEFAVQKKKR
ncbi:MAG: purine-nucleoside phosphorylase [SAR324 cluster bacterium]|nr:purine-nucleoside phosphorylase [SAR324 cluster bacterium]